MKTLRRVLLIVCALVLVSAAWLWWNRPRRVDMAGYVPADTVLYVEADSLPEVARGITSTDAWRALAPAAGIEVNFGNVGWQSRAVAWTGLGPAEAVVLARAQVAVSVQGFSAEEEPASTLKIVPRLALVAETHTSESRVREVVEKLVGDFARRAYGQPRVEKSEAGGASYVTWTSPTNERRKVVAAVEGSVAVVGNDRGAVEACLGARRGERPSLSGDPQLFAMRERMRAPGALAFGYISRDGATLLVEMLAPAYFRLNAADPKTESIVASFLPDFSRKVLGGAAWSARVKEGALEDSYFLSLQNGVAARLGEALAAGDATHGAGELLPADTYQITRYNYRDPEAAWRGLNAALSSQLDLLSASLVGRVLEAAAASYGVEDPQAFLRAAGPDLTTARLDDGGESTVLVVGVRDREALEREVRKHLGAGARTVRADDETLLVSADEAGGAASFVGDYLIMGSEESVRRCLDARAAKATLSATESFGQLSRAPSTHDAAVTLTDDRASAKHFVSYFARASDAQTAAAAGDVAFRQKLAPRAYAVTRSRFVADGYERQTLSSFGNFGALVTRFAPPKSE